MPRTLNGRMGQGSFLPSRPILVSLILTSACLLPFLLNGCTGSGAVNPLTPASASRPDSANQEVSDTIYWALEALTPPLTDSLNGVAVLSKKLGYICGNNGTILRYDGSQWAKVETGLAKNENLMAVAFSGEHDGWIVGSHGTLLSYKNGTWTQDSSPTQETLYDLAVAGTQTVWACGANGTLLTYNGVSWGKVPVLEEVPGASPITLLDDLYGLDLSDQNNGWAVGARGRLLRYDGAKWSPVASNTTEKLNSVHVLNGVQAWAVGAFGTILRFNGTSWNKMGSAPSGADLFQVRMRKEDDGWVTGQDGTILYYDGTRWISHQKPAAKPSLNAFSFYKEDGWMVGSNGSVLKFHASGSAASVHFKGEMIMAPSQSSSSWTLVYQVGNKGVKSSSFLTFELPVPKGLEPFQDKATRTPTPGPSPGSTPSPGPTTPFPMGVSPAATPPSSEWKMKDGKVVQDLGSLSPAESRAVTLMFREKKDQKWELPLVLKAVLKQMDRPNLESAPLTLIAAPATPVATPGSSPAATRSIPAPEK